MRRLALRLSMFAYALSCAGNVLALRRPEDTSEGESTSGREQGQGPGSRKAEDQGVAHRRFEAERREGVDHVEVLT